VTAPRSIDFLGVPLRAITTKEFIDYVIAQTVDCRAAPISSPLFITYLNAACSNLAASVDDYREILHNADIVYADGQAIVWASRWLGTPIPERVNAADFFVEFCQSAAAQGLRLYFLGSYPGIAPAAAERLTAQVPGLTVCGTEHGFFEGEGEAVVRAIRAAQPDILIVGMGVPRQERWAWKHRNELRVPTIWCVGALFEYYSGYRWRAPVWMRRAGLEWLFRLVLEPRRLWRRYIIGNVVFLARVVRAVAHRF
jgi:N-acetylglucosaminyldiphosphoundecaprenol N-acetyl-beta-D-mannosaminyltransferase